MRGERSIDECIVHMREKIQEYCGKPAKDEAGGPETASADGSAETGAGGPGGGGV